MFVRLIVHPTFAMEMILPLLCILMYSFGMFVLFDNDLIHPRDEKFFIDIVIMAFGGWLLVTRIQRSYEIFYKGIENIDQIINHFRMLHRETLQMLRNFSTKKTLHDTQLGDDEVVFESVQQFENYQNFFDLCTAGPVILMFLQQKQFRSSSDYDELISEIRTMTGTSGHPEQTLLTRLSFHAASSLISFTPLRSTKTIHIRTPDDFWALFLDANSLVFTNMHHPIASMPQSLTTISSIHQLHHELNRIFQDCDTRDSIQIPQMFGFPFQVLIFAVLCYLPFIVWAQANGSWLVASIAIFVIDFLYMWFYILTYEDLDPMSKFDGIQKTEFDVINHFLDHFAEMYRSYKPMKP